MQDDSAEALLDGEKRPLEMVASGRALEAKRSSKAGESENRVELAQARTQEATFVYQRTVQQAFREVSDALVAYRKGQEIRAKQQQLTIAA